VFGTLAQLARTLAYAYDVEIIEAPPSFQEGRAERTADRMAEVIAHALAAT